VRVGGRCRRSRPATSGFIHCRWPQCCRVFCAARASKKSSNAGRSRA